MPIAKLGTSAALCLMVFTYLVLKKINNLTNFIAVRIINALKITLDVCGTLLRMILLFNVFIKKCVCAIRFWKCVQYVAKNYTQRCFY